MSSKLVRCNQADGSWQCTVTNRRISYTILWHFKPGFFHSGRLKDRASILPMAIAHLIQRTHVMPQMNCSGMIQYWANGVRESGAQVQETAMELFGMDDSTMKSGVGLTSRTHHLAPNKRLMEMISKLSSPPFFIQLPHKFCSSERFKLVLASPNTASGYQFRPFELVDNDGIEGMTTSFP